MVEPRRQREGRERHRLRFLAQDAPRVEVRRGCGMWVFFCVQRSHQIRQAGNLGAPRVGGRRRRDARRMGTRFHRESVAEDDARRLQHRARAEILLFFREIRAFLPSFHAEARHHGGRGEPRARVRVEISPPPVERRSTRIFAVGEENKPRRQARLRRQRHPPAPRIIFSALQVVVRDVRVATRLVAVYRYDTKAARRRGDRDGAVAKMTPRRSKRFIQNARHGGLVVNHDVPRL
mmetsp:Transcript_6292/g.26738  ORF Transcript_6292/g.26738 Transcript_6292/m.26738 type:complete len:235 (-) Transcript_6292:923-1627(-)